MKTRIILFALLFTGCKLWPDAQFTQYMYNTININPACWIKRALSIFCVASTQWVGLDGAPVTNAVSVNTPLQQQVRSWCVCYQR
jgi:hypothetical protein